MDRGRELHRNLQDWQGAVKRTERLVEEWTQGECGAET